MIEGMIQVPIQKVNDLIHEVYRNSVPVGYGHLHHEEGDLPDGYRIGLHKEFLERYQEAGLREWEWDNDTAIRHIMTMDYIKGRCCKMHIYRDKKGNVYIHERWADHDWLQLQALCDVLELNVDVPEYLGERLAG